MTRPSWESIWIRTAHLLAERGTCSRAQVGCVFVTPDQRHVASGYNGSPAGHPHCVHDNGGDMENGSCAKAVHAEANAIAWAARKGVAIEGCTAYVTHAPCATCLKLLLSAGIASIVYDQAYRLHPQTAACPIARQYQWP